MIFVCIKGADVKLNSKMNIKSFLTGLLACALITGFSSCSKDDENSDENGSSSSDNTFTLAVENENSKNIAVIKADSYLYSQDVVFATGTYSDGSVTLKMPETVDGKYLTTIAAGTSDGLTISNETSMLQGVHITAYDSDGKSIRGIRGKSDEYSDITVDFWYVGSAVTVTGSNEKGDIDWNCSLKKGWNLVYEISVTSNNDTYTTTPPAGLKLYCPK
jgi:hypothetical protein